LTLVFSHIAGSDNELEGLNREQPKTKPQPSTTQQLSGRANFELSRSNNVMVSDLPYTYYNTARDAAEEFFGSAPLEVFEDNKDHIVDAHFLSEVSEGTNLLRHVHFIVALQHLIKTYYFAHIWA